MSAHVRADGTANLQTRSHTHAVLHLRLPARPVVPKMLQGGHVRPGAGPLPGRPLQPLSVMSLSPCLRIAPGRPRTARRWPPTWTTQPTFSWYRPTSATGARASPTPTTTGQRWGSCVWLAWVSSVGFGGWVRAAHVGQGACHRVIRRCRSAAHCPSLRETAHAAVCLPGLAAAWTTLWPLPLSPSAGPDLGVDRVAGQAGHGPHRSGERRWRC